MKNNVLPGGLDLAAKGVVFLFGILLARSLGAEEFGLWSIASAILVYCFLLIDFSSLQVGIKKTIDSENASLVFSEIIFLKSIGIFACFNLILALYLFKIINIDLSVGLFFTSLIYFLNFEFCYRSKFRITFAALQNFTAAMIPLFIFYFFYSGNSSTVDIVYLRAISCFFVFIFFAFIFFNKSKISYKFDYDNFDLKPYIHVLIGAFLARLYFNSDVLIIQSVLTVADVGMYSAIATFYVIFITFRGVAINTIYPGLCVAYKTGDYRVLVYKYTAFFSIAILPILFLFYFFSEAIIEIVFGTQYITKDTITVFNVYLIIAALLTIGFLLPNTLHIQGKALSFMFITGSAAFLNITFNFIYLDKLGIVAAAYSTLIAELVVISYSYYFFRRDIK